MQAWWGHLEVKQCNVHAQPSLCVLSSISKPLVAVVPVTQAEQRASHAGKALCQSAGAALCVHPLGRKADRGFAGYRGPTVTIEGHQAPDALTSSSAAQGHTDLM